MKLFEILLSLLINSPLNVHHATATTGIGWLFHWGLQIERVLFQLNSQSLIITLKFYIVVCCAIPIAAQAVVVPFQFHTHE